MLVPNLQAFSYSNERTYHASSGQLQLVDVLDEVVLVLEENNLSYTETNRELVTFPVSGLQLVILLPQVCC